VLPTGLDSVLPTQMQDCGVLSTRYENTFANNYIARWWAGWVVVVVVTGYLLDDTDHDIFNRPAI